MQLLQFLSYFEKEKNLHLCIANVELDGWMAQTMNETG